MICATKVIPCPNYVEVQDSDIFFYNIVGLDKHPSGDYKFWNEKLLGELRKMIDDVSKLDLRYGKITINISEDVITNTRRISFYIPEEND